MAKAPSSNAAQRVRKKVRKNVADGVAGWFSRKDPLVELPHALVHPPSQGIQMAWRGRIDGGRRQRVVIAPRHFSKVLLPDPLGPISPTTSPGATLMLTSFSASTAAAPTP